MQSIKYIPYRSFISLNNNQIISINTELSRTTNDTTMNTPPPLRLQGTSLTSETLIKTTNNIGLSPMTPSLSMIADNN